MLSEIHEAHFPSKLAKPFLQLLIIVNGSLHDSAYRTYFKMFFMPLTDDRIVFQVPTALCAGGSGSPNEGALGCDLLLLSPNIFKADSARRSVSCWSELLFVLLNSPSIA